MDIIRALLVLGADNRIRNKAGFTPLECLDVNCSEFNEIQELFSMYDWKDKGDRYEFYTLFFTAKIIILNILLTSRVFHQFKF